MKIWISYAFSLFCPRLLLNSKPIQYTLNMILISISFIQYTVNMILISISFKEKKPWLFQCITTKSCIRRSINNILTLELNLIYFILHSFILPSKFMDSIFKFSTEIAKTRAETTETIKRAESKTDPIQSKLKLSFWTLACKV